MAYDIQDDELPLRVRVRLRERGWRFNQDQQRWTKMNGAGIQFSENPEDHQRAWDIDIRDVTTEVEAEEERERTAAQMNATPGDTGTSQPLTNPGVNIMERSGDQISSQSVQDGKVAGFADEREPEDATQA